MAFVRFGPWGFFITMPNAALTMPCLFKSIARRSRHALVAFCALAIIYPAAAQAQQVSLPDFLTGGQQQQGQGQQALPPAPPPVTNNLDDSQFAIDKTPGEIETQAREQAFDAALEWLLPLRPNEIRKLLEHFDRTQESVELPVYPSPQPEVTVQTLPLDPGTPPATIYTAFGHVTTLNILDITGAPWPIEDISWAGNFEVVEGAAGAGSHIVRISPQSEFGRGNMSIRLLTLNTPIILTLENSRERVHYRFDAIIPEQGPLAEAQLIESSGAGNLQAGDRNLSAILEGVPPGKSTRLNVAGVDGRTSAYRFNSNVYLRTPLTLLSPAWSASVSSADGMRVYEIPDTPVVLLSNKGKMVRARLSERENVFDE